MIMKMIQEQTLGDRKKCWSREEDLHPIFEAVMLIWVKQWWGQKKKDIKRNTGKSNRKEEEEGLLLKTNLKKMICQQNVSELLMRRNSLNWNLTHLSWQNTQMTILFSFRRKTSKIISWSKLLYILICNK